MKQKIMLFSALLVIGFISSVAFGIYDFGNVSFERQTVEVEKIVEVNELEKRINDALHAKANEINEVGVKARDEAQQQLRDSIELEVREAYSKELEVKELELRKKQKAY
jgi:hypothetical protein